MNASRSILQFSLDAREILFGQGSQLSTSKIRSGSEKYWLRPKDCESDWYMECPKTSSTREVVSVSDNIYIHMFIPRDEGTGDGYLLIVPQRSVNTNFTMYFRDLVLEFLSAYTSQTSYGRCWEKPVRQLLHYFPIHYIYYVVLDIEFCPLITELAQNKSSIGVVLSYIERFRF